MTNERDPGPFEKLAVEIGQLVDVKNVQYGEAFALTGEFLRLLYPQGMSGADYNHALLLARMFDKMVRIASPNRRVDEENPYSDLAGYGLLGQEIWNRERTDNDV
jgi:hypothetical protein